MPWLLLVVIGVAGCDSAEAGVVPGLARDERHRTPDVPPLAFRGEVKASQYVGREDWIVRDRPDELLKVVAVKSECGCGRVHVLS
jgi:hypothetical protein